AGYRFPNIGRRQSYMPILLKCGTRGRTLDRDELKSRQASPKKERVAFYLSEDLADEIRNAVETIAKMPGFGMASEGPLAYSFGPNLHARRTKPCSVRVRIAPIPRKGSQRLQSCRSQRSSRTIAPTRDKRVLVVTTRPIVTNSPIGRCTIWGILTHGVRVISW